MPSAVVRRVRQVSGWLGVPVVVAGFLVATTAAPAGAVTNPAPSAGTRKNATRLTFTISGTARLSVDVATGNALFTDTLVRLPGVVNDVPISLSYNSSVWGTSVPSAVTGTNGSGWAITGFDQRLVSNSDGSVTYYGPQGLTGVFTAAASGGYNSPSQFQATLTANSGGGWTLTYHGSQSKYLFNSAGQLTSVKDRNGNATTFGYDGGGHPASITSSRGPAAGRLLNVLTSGGRITSLSQTSGSLSRSIGFGYSSGGHLASVTDTVGGVTSFASAPGTDTGQLVQFTNPQGHATTITLGSSGKVEKVAQDNPTADHGAGTAYTRLSYPSGQNQTLVADPTTDQSQAVSAVPHTTYTLTSDGSQLVASTTNPDSHTRSATYTPLGDLQSATNAVGGTSSLSYAANGGESLTQVTSPGGASQSALYGNTGPSQYSPSSSTDDAGNSLTYGYDSAGNQSTTSQSGSSGPPATVQYNPDGTASTSASPGAAAGVVTRYSYDSDHDLTGITPPSNSSLGSRTFTWDSFGRLATATTGMGDATVGYTYDNADRLTRIHYSTGTVPDLTYSYDPLYRITQRVDGSGTTSYSYDDLGHLVSTSNTAGGGIISYTYDLAGALASETTAAGTVSYGYDPAHQLNAITYPQAGTTYTTKIANDADGRRTDIWLQSNSDHSSWTAHEHWTYDASGRVTNVTAQNGPASAPTTIFNQSLCFSAGAVAPNCPSTSSADRHELVWVSDSVSGETTSYTYDSTERLTKAVITGGNNPRTHTYGYDQAANRTSASTTGNNPTSQSLAYNDANQISSTGYSYDGAGNLTAWPGHTATYNLAGQQTTTTNGGVATSYSYAGTTNSELLSQTTTSGATYHYVYGRADHNGQPEIETVSTGNFTGYLFHDPSGKPVMLQSNTGITGLYLYDGTGNPAALALSNDTTSYTYSYSPYGVPTRTDQVTASNDGTDDENPYLFQTGLQDRASGLIKFGQRWYNPETGSWTQQDTRNTPLDPHNGNRYAYAADDPINHRDPTGRDIIDDITSSLNVSVTGCYYLCLSLGVQEDRNGNYALTGGIGVGSPGVSASFGGSTGTAGTGIGAAATCSLGNVSGSVDTGGNVSYSLGTTYSTGQCSVTATGSVEL